MPDSIPDLWSDVINLDDIPPINIFDKQASIIEDRTHGKIVAEVIQRETPKYTELFFEIVSEAAKHRSRLLVCRYLKEEVYPCYISSMAFRLQGGSATSATNSILRGLGRIVSNPLQLDPEELEATRVAASQAVLMDLVGNVFQSNWVRGKISSMIAKVNHHQTPLKHVIVESSKI